MKIIDFLKKKIDEIKLNLAAKREIKSTMIYKNLNKTYLNEYDKALIILCINLNFDLKSLHIYNPQSVDNFSFLNNSYINSKFSIYRSIDFIFSCPTKNNYWKLITQIVIKRLQNEEFMISKQYPFDYNQELIELFGHINLSYKKNYDNFEYFWDYCRKYINLDYSSCFYFYKSIQIIEFSIIRSPLYNIQRLRINAYHDSQSRKNWHRNTYNEQRYTSSKSTVNNSLVQCFQQSSH